jgi:hypothetical protein
MLNRCLRSNYSGLTPPTLGPGAAPASLQTSALPPISMIWNTLNWMKVAGSRRAPTSTTGDTQLHLMIAVVRPVAIALDPGRSQRYCSPIPVSRPFPVLGILDALENIGFVGASIVFEDLQYDPVRP